MRPLLAALLLVSTAAPVPLPMPSASPGYCARECPGDEDCVRDVDPLPGQEHERYVCCYKGAQIPCEWSHY